MTRWLGAGAGDDADGGPSTGAAAGRGAAAAGRDAADGARGAAAAAGGDAAVDATSRRPARADGGRGRLTRTRGRVSQTRGRVVAAVSRLATRWTAALLVVVATILAGVFATPLGSAPGVVALLAVLIMVLAMLATSRSYGSVGPRYGPGLRRVAAAPPVVIAQTDPDTAARPRPRAPTAQLVPLSCPSRCSRSEGSRHALRSRPACPGHSRARPRPLLRCGAARR